VCREPPFPFNKFNFSSSKLPCDLELVKHAEQRQLVRKNQRANIFHLLKSRALCMRTGVVSIGLFSFFVHRFKFVAGKMIY
jgi:hypothetical protein